MTTLMCFRYRIMVEGAREQVSYAAAPVSLEVGLDVVREDQLSLLLSDGAVRRLIRCVGDPGSDMVKVFTL